jgi:ATP-dependent protease ClpP protease subunit
VKNQVSLQQMKMLSKIKAKDPELATRLSNLNIGWYALKNQADDDTADLYIYDEIMPQWMAEWVGGVSAEGLIAELNEITAGTINVRINSPGGSVFEAIAIYNTLVSHQATINVFVDALAASAASVIAMAGDTVTMMVGSQLMIHDAMGIEMGNAKEMREFATFLDGQSDNIASIYAARAGGDAADYRQMMIAETWATAQEAVDLGLADKVYSKPAAPPPDDDPEKKSEEDPEEDKPDEEEESPENLLHKKHNLTNKGFKYAGRKRAPNPSGPVNVTDDAVDRIMAKLRSPANA